MSLKRFQQDISLAKKDSTLATLLSLESSRTLDQTSLHHHQDDSVHEMYLFYCMKLFLPSLVFILVWHVVVVTAINDNEEENYSFAIAAYLPDYRLHHININNTAPFLTDLILFSLEPHPELDDINKMMSSCCLGEGHFAKARQATVAKKEQEQESTTSSGTSPLKLWMTIGGGGGRSEFFHKANAKLVEAIRRLAIREKLSGIDFNCEYFLSAQDFDRYKRWLLQDAIPALKQEGLFVSIALHPGFFLPKEMYQAIDRIHLMTYDMPSPSGGYHADFKKLKEAVSQLINSGCEPRKILFGIPAYARHSQNPSMAKTFAELYDQAMEANSAARDQVLERNEWGGYRFEAPGDVERKVRYAMEQQLGGIFFWELGQDKQVEGDAPGGYLLEAAAAPLSNHGHKFGTEKMNDEF